MKDIYSMHMIDNSQFVLQITLFAREISDFKT